MRLTKSVGRKLATIGRTSNSVIACTCYCIVFTQKLNMKTLLIIVSIIFTGLGVSKPLKHEKAITFIAGDEQTVAAYQGVFHVTENRKSNSGKTIPLHYVRFPSTSKSPGKPIVYLAGGPGGSGIATAKYRRFELFMAMREVADVIAFDQRGTGDSNTLPECKTEQHLPSDQPISDEQYITLNQKALKSCFAFWRNQGIDYAAYTTPESVADLDDLRIHLNADKISLWGISYGSHLALAAMKTMGDKLHKVIIASAEGLSQTIKYPARTDAYFTRLEKALNDQSKTIDTAINIKSLMRRVHDKLDTQPLMISWQEEGQQINHYLQARNMKQIASAMISDPARAQQMLMFYHTVDAGLTGPITEVIKEYFNPQEPIKFRLMSSVMDLASGISPSRRTVIEKQAQSALLGGFLNFSLYFSDLAYELNLDLGEAFRKEVTSDVPTLLLSGTLDGRTYIESQHEAVAQLSDVTKITVKNAGHNLFKSSPKVIETMLQFMRDEPIKEHVIVVDLD